MNPIAFQVAGYPVRYPGLLYVAAAIVAWVYAHRVARRKGWDSELVLPGVALVVSSAYLGARLLGTFMSPFRLPNEPLTDMLLPGGLSFFGGLALGSIVMLAFVRLAKLPLGETFDALAPVAPVVYAMFRLGCFLNGDDYGRSTSLPWGMSFPEGSPPTFERVHPTQLYEVLLMVPILLVVRAGSGTRRPGVVAFGLCAMMGIERLLVEFTRSGTGGQYYLAAAQWLGLALAAVGLAGLARLWAQAPPA